MIVLRMVMAQEYSLSLHLSLASPTLAHRGDETCVVLVAAGGSHTLLILQSSRNQ